MVDQEFVPLAVNVVAEAPQPTPSKYKLAVESYSLISTVSTVEVPSIASPVTVEFHVRGAYVVPSAGLEIDTVAATGSAPANGDTVPDKARAPMETTASRRNVAAKYFRTSSST